MNKCCCQYCGELFANNRLNYHELKCFKNPENVEVLTEYFLQGLEDINKLSWTKVYQFCLNNKISTSSTIMMQLGITEWQDALICILLNYYEDDIITDFELFDLLIGKLTLWLYNQPKSDYIEAKHAYFKQFYDVDLINDTPIENYHLLFTAVINQAIKDYRVLKDNQTTDLIDDGLEIKLSEVDEFLQLFAPNILNQIEAGYII